MNHNKIVMTPIKGNVKWSDVINDIQSVDNFLTGDDFTFTMSGVTGTANLSFHTLTFTYESSKGVVEQKAPFRVISTGIEFFQPLEIEGKKITQMTTTIDDKELVTFTDATKVLRR